MSAESPGRRPNSLARDLLVWLLVPLLALVPLTAAVLHTLALRPALDGLDRALTDTAVALAQIVEEKDGRTTLPLSEQTARALRADLLDETFFAVGDSQLRLLGGAPELLALAPPLERGQWRFFESTLGGKPVRVAAHGTACGPSGAGVCPVMVAETLRKRDAAERAVLLAALVGASVLALAMVALAMMAVNRGMRPLRRAAADVATRSPDRLEPIDERSVPREVVAFVSALNELFARLREAAAAQRAFIADAAHQLRTPLAVLRIEASQALTLPHAESLRPTLERLHAAAERGARLAHQLLALARAEGAAIDPSRRMERIDLARLAAQAADQWLQPSLDAGQDLGFDLEPAWVDGDSLLLEELLGNLIHNAIEHAGPGARITIRSREQEGHAQLCVEDDGRGIPAEEMATAWHRFRRGQGAVGTGSGLGLAIVADIAQLHGARAKLSANEGGKGLRVCVDFPSAR